MAKVKVKIAVAVDTAGNWYACGQSGKSTYVNEASMDKSIKNLPSTFLEFACYWVTAELDIPEIETKEVVATQVEPVNF